MSNVFNSNLALLVPRRADEWHHAFVSEEIAIDVAISSASREGNYFFPLYFFSLSEKKGLFHAEGATRQPNIKPEVFKSLSQLYKKAVSPEEIFYYIYAVLYSETYRAKYAEFLKIDFPRIPFTKDYNPFKQMSEYGNRLVDLHLLKSPELDSPIARFQGKGANRVEKPKYDDKAGCVFINKEQYFESIPQDVWSYQIGGYQVCEKWLKDRKERILSLDEIQTYCRIVTALQETIEIQRAIDVIYEKVEADI
jgi:predicted helicase